MKILTIIMICFALIAVAGIAAADLHLFGKSEKEVKLSHEERQAFSDMDVGAIQYGAILCSENLCSMTITDESGIINQSVALRKHNETQAQVAQRLQEFADRRLHDLAERQLQAQRSVEPEVIAEPMDVTLVEVSQ